jgi:hypothetical protein
MSDIYHAITSINIQEATDAQLLSISRNGCSASNALHSGISAIGELSFWASENDSFCESDMRAALSNIGLFLREAPRMAEALSFVSAEAESEKHKRAKDKKVNF